MSADPAVEDDREQTPWTSRGAGSVRTLLLSESGGAGVLVAAILAALLWANQIGRAHV